MNDRIWLSLAHMGGREQEFIQEAFNTNWVTPLGPNVDRFEKSLQDFLMINDRQLMLNSKYVVALSSGTAAIHLGLIQLGVQPGDEVVCQSFTFAASANPIAYLKATPVFVDSELNTWNMSPWFLDLAIKDRIKKTGKKPKAIIPVHLYGMPGNIDEICQIARQYEIPILEDAAEALGSEYKGQKCGTFGEFACLSFNGNKMITTSGGGALVCSTREQADKTKYYATQARDNAPHYQHSQIGYNYRMSNICAGIGRGQMDVLEVFVSRRREIHQLYKQYLSFLPGITIFDDLSKDYKSNHWLTCILIDPKIVKFTREDVRLLMEKENIETRPLWKPMHLQPVFANTPFYGDGTSENLFEKGLCLPSGPALTNKDIERVCNIIKSCYG
ncbi:dTDP-4-amino-4,6-dideoxygalactose transaminase [Parabacteroides sp. PH5-13]|uniref:DegT/DnrJ/EryC1/StrS family aminotransferase n=1 Tax=unclassified Parabacteroides TaxID=2649774 RepID=UPI002473A3A8|nr:MULTISPECIES: aminotransferase class I/II-fold pyridoxal phosphate-dependent enzyme [unclassified Parabacteroides]MDH6305594.1 dTDP-4-amino-4,6-dideoxygalactose transaminase [Parabacteroides sp. PH5-39]MDH6319851.1 dTDP-4-amino-4,6-dideoxygalactose transaminase [Parabacteroides sp. PH5-13]MDH6323558.1 dTDP-4-amino-4,6-dideoxygalactose transaminase [Parabacteroides sp. PH5-8]MDH6384670.1 dTDP-4-amino-4,6-dideoxygalactose transaminase [Parabacteroides sp. PH5-17]MDH6394025.1 dTDP-4-amino-4,6-